MLTFANSAGFWALLGLPLLVLIHCLQRKARRLPVSTLFLLPPLPVPSHAGRKLERWRSSRAFWLQVLAVLLLAWLLAQPRLLEEDSSQQIALVLDSSISMDAFRTEIIMGLTHDSSRLQTAATTTEWTLMESNATRPPLYKGLERAALLSALDHWQPNLGSHDPAAALRNARAAVGPDGLVVFVSDRPMPLPADVLPVSYASPIENVGIAAAGDEVDSMGKRRWKILARNYSAVPLRRTWWLETETGHSKPATLEFGPGQALAVEGYFPEGIDRVTFVLEPDAFTADDRAPLVASIPKTMRYAVVGPDGFAERLQPLLASLTAVQPTASPQEADLIFSCSADYAPLPSASQLFFRQTSDEVPLTRNPAAPEPSALMEGLNWGGLLYHTAAPFVPDPSDEPLLWSADGPLILLRPHAFGKDLLFNFDPRFSNAGRLPAFVLLVHRYVNERRASRPAPERANRLGAQPLHLHLPENARVSFSVGNTSPKQMTSTAAALLNVPSPPTFFEVTADGQAWLTGASLFPDPRESDFSSAASAPLPDATVKAQANSRSRADPFTPLWLLLLLAALLGSWKEKSSKQGNIA